jgi:hypothetical protein
VFSMGANLAMPGAKGVKVPFGGCCCCSVEWLLCRRVSFVGLVVGIGVAEAVIARRRITINGVATSCRREITNSVTRLQVTAYKINTQDRAGVRNPMRERG